MTASIAQGLSPTQLAVLQRVAESVQPLQPQQGQQQQRSPQPTTVPPPSTGRGRLIDILV